MATWAKRKRVEFIADRLKTVGRINRADLREYFAISLQTATADFHSFEDANPGIMVFDGRIKAFVRPDLVSPDSRDTLRRAAPELLFALRKLTMMARTSGGTAGSDEALMAACDEAEAAIARATAPNPSRED